MVFFYQCGYCVFPFPKATRYLDVIDSFQEYFQTTEEEAMELVPHITLNPSFNIDMLEFIEAESTSSSSILAHREIGSNSHDSEGHHFPEEHHDDGSDEINLVNSPLKRKNVNSRPNG